MNLLPGRYLILGASGLLGSHALLALRDKENIHVRAVGGRRLPRVEGANINANCVDLSALEGLAELFKEVDYVFVCAGLLSTTPVLAADPFHSVLTTLRVSINAIEAAWRAGVKRCVIISSSCGYPESNKPLKEDQMFQGEPPEQWHALGNMTRYLEKLCESVSSKVKNPMALTVLRPSMVYGEYDHFDITSHFLPAMIRRVVAREKPIEVWGDGTQRRDLVHAEDVIRAGLISLAHPDPLITINIGAGKSHSVNEILEYIIRADDYSNAQIKYIETQIKSPALRNIDTTKAKAILKFSPNISLSIGIERTLSWYKQSIIK